MKAAEINSGTTAGFAFSRRSFQYMPAFLFFAYVLFRSWSVSFTHDEALTFLNYITHSWAEVFDVRYTNNHLLNSLLAKITYHLFGSSEFALRLPNTLAALLFSISTIQLLRRLLPGKFIWILAFAAISFNSFQAEFFSLCRGYGLSLGLMFSAFYFLLRYAEDRSRTRHALISILLMGLAAFANYTLLLPFLIHAGAILFVEIGSWFTFPRPFFSIRNPRFRSGILLPLLIIFLLWRLLHLILYIRSFGGENFNFGGANGFWTDTVSSLAASSFLGEWRMVYAYAGESFPRLMMLFTAAVFLLSAIVLFLRLLQDKKSISVQFQFYLFSILFFSGTGIWLMNKMLGIPFSTDRTAIYFVPVFSLFLCLVFLSDGRAAFFRKTLAVIFFIHPVLSFLVTMNGSVAENWKFNQGNREACAVLFGTDPCNTGYVLVDTDYLVYPVYNYYRLRSEDQIRSEKLIYSETFFAETGFRGKADYYFGNTDPGEKYDLIWTGTECRLWKYKGCYCDSQLVQWNESKLPENQILPNGERVSAWVNSDGHNHLAYRGDTIRDTIPAGNWFCLRATVCPEKIYGVNPMQVQVKRGEQEILNRQLPLDHFTGTGLQEKVYWADCPLDLLPGDIVYTFVYVTDASKIYLTDLSVSLNRRSDCNIR